jgi:hypothetical protein
MTSSSLTLSCTVNRAFLSSSFFALTHSMSHGLSCFSSLFFRPLALSISSSSFFIFIWIQAERGIPLISSAFKLADNSSRCEYVLWLNTDIAVMRAFGTTLNAALSGFFAVDCVCACVRVCVCACVCACTCVCVCVCVRVCWLFASGCRFLSWQHKTMCDVAVSGCVFSFFVLCDVHRPVLCLSSACVLFPYACSVMCIICACTLSLCVCSVTCIGRPSVSHLLCASTERHEALSHRWTARSNGYPRQSHRGYLSRR